MKRLQIKFGFTVASFLIIVGLVMLGLLLLSQPAASLEPGLDTESSGAFKPTDHASIGLVGKIGEVTYDLEAEVYTILGAGQDIWDSADAFHYLYQPLVGDGQIIARILSLQATHPWAKAGVMIRNDLHAGAPHAFMAVTPDNGVAFQRRLNPNGRSVGASRIDARTPIWVKVVRQANMLRGYYSADGLTWQLGGWDTAILILNDIGARG